MSDRFGKPTISERERQEAIRRAQKKRVPKTRFIANSVPGSVLRWLVANEEAVLSRAATPSMPADVLAWLEERGVAFSGGGGEPLASEKAEPEAQIPLGDYPLQTASKCEVCGASFEPKRRDARFCSSACRVAAHRRAAA